MVNLEQIAIFVKYVFQRPWDVSNDQKKSSFIDDVIFREGQKIFYSKVDILYTVERKFQAGQSLFGTYVRK